MPGKNNNGPPEAGEPLPMFINRLEDQNEPWSVVPATVVASAVPPAAPPPAMTATVIPSAPSPSAASATPVVRFCRRREAYTCNHHSNGRQTTCDQHAPSRIWCIAKLGAIGAEASTQPLNDALLQLCQSYFHRYLSFSQAPPHLNSLTISYRNSTELRRG